MVRRGPRIIAISDVGRGEEGYYSSDVDMHTLNEMATDSILDSKIEMPEKIRAYHQYRGNITSADRVILYKDRVIVPPTLHGQVLSTLHAADLGLSMMTAHAESSVPTSVTVPLEKKLRTLLPDGILTAGAPPIPPNPVIYPFQAVFSYFFVHGCTSPRDSGQILKLANHGSVDR